MKTIFTLIIGLMFSFVSFAQLADCNAYFSYTVDTDAMTVEFYDGSWGSDSLNPQMQAISWDWQINGESYTTQNLTYIYTNIPFVACLNVSFDNGCTSSFCDTIYVEIPDPCADYIVEAGYDIVDPGACDGEISVSISGGTAPYSYNWGNFGTTEIISNLCEGNYTVTVIDANGCTGTSTGYVAVDDSSNQGISKINTIEAVNNVNLYPNPVKEIATIEYKLIKNSNVTISIIDYTGKVIKTTSLNSYKGNNTVTLNTSTLNSGIYFAKIVSNKTVKTIKFIK